MSPFALGFVLLVAVFYLGYLFGTIRRKKISDGRQKDVLFLSGLIMNSIKGFDTSCEGGWEWKQQWLKIADILRKEEMS